MVSKPRHSATPIARCARSLVPLLSAVVILFPLLLGACQTQASEREPTREEAVAFLAKVVDLAQRRDFTGLCELGGGNCERILEEAGREAVPVDAPNLVTDFVMMGTGPADARSATGRVLVLCGVGRDGGQYRTEMLVFFSNVKLIAIEPVYWSGVTIARDNTTTSGPIEVACDEA